MNIVIEDVKLVEARCQIIMEAERQAPLELLFGGVVLHHGQYPMEGRPKRERYSSKAAALRAVRARYEGEVGWWFSITRAGKEIWSSDHELEALRAKAAQ